MSNFGNGANLTTSRSTPVVDFTSHDFDSLKQDLISYGQSKFSDRWTDFNDDQFAVVFLDLLSYCGDLISYHVDASIRETFAATAMRRQNLQNIAKSFEYVIPGPVSAHVDLVITLDPDGTYPFTITQADNQFSNGGTGDAEVFFQPDADFPVSTYPPGGTVTVPCTEGEVFIDQLIGVSDGSPNQRWQFPQQGVVLDSVSIRVGGASWTGVTNFIRSQSTATVYKLTQTDDGNTFATFGDGVYGVLPATNQQILATFRVGGGTRGNLSFNTITTKVSAHANIISVNNPDRSSEGDNALPLKAARNSLSSVLSTLNRGVTAVDYEQLAMLVDGVAKVRAAPGIPLGQRQIRMYVAPSGGGAPTSSLLNTLSKSFVATRMVTNRIKLYSAIYRDLVFNVLLHINPAFRANEVKQAVHLGITNTDGTGLLDFSQLDFEGVTKDVNGNEELLLSQTRLQNYFASLSNIGLDRAEILELGVVPVAFPKDTGNTGDGSVTNITINTKQRRRQYYVRLKSSAQYAVYERIVGTVFSLSDNTITDDTKVFEDEGIADYAGYKIAPLKDSSTELTISKAIGSDITVVSAPSLFALTQVGMEYYMYSPTPTILSVGQTYTSPDGTVSFSVVKDSRNFIAGDEFTLDIYPHISDIRLRFDEYPELLEDNFTVRSSGGSKV